MSETAGPIRALFAIDRDLCTGCGLCRGMAPDNIGEAKAGLSRVVRQPRTRDEESLCQEAADSCPIGALAPSSGEEAAPVLQPTQTLQASAD